MPAAHPQLLLTMDPQTITLLYSPFPSMETARAASRGLIEAKLAACCNLLPGGESHYRWEGTYTIASEVILLAKTTAGQRDQAIDLLRRHHPYECPAILSFEASSTPAFAAWVASVTH